MTDTSTETTTETKPTNPRAAELRRIAVNINRIADAIDAQPEVIQGLAFYAHDRSLATTAVQLQNLAAKAVEIRDSIKSRVGEPSGSDFGNEVDMMLAIEEGTPWLIAERLADLTRKHSHFVADGQPIPPRAEEAQP